MTSHDNNNSDGNSDRQIQRSLLRCISGAVSFERVLLLVFFGIVLATGLLTLGNTLTNQMTQNPFASDPHELDRPN